jgi:hypothetical protein
LDISLRLAAIVGHGWRGVSALAGTPSLPACNPYDGKLDSTSPNVIYDDPHFVFGGKRFPVQVFSLASPAPWSPNFICLRYQVENVGDEIIPLLFWNLIDEWSATDLPTHDPWTRVRRRPSATKEAVRGPTVIKAFRSEEVSTTAYLTIEDWPTKKAATSDSTPYLRFERSAVLDLAAAKAIEERQIPDVEVAVVEPSGDPTGVPPPVGDILITRFGEITTESSVYIAGQARDVRVPTYGVSSRINIRPKANVRIQAFAPALVAMERLRGGGTTTDYLELLKDSRGPIPRLSDKFDFQASIMAGDTQLVFIVEHPVTVQWSGPEGEGSICIRTAAYSPFPVSVGQSYCVR